MDPSYLSNSTALAAQIESLQAQLTQLIGICLSFLLGSHPPADTSAIYSFPVGFCCSCSRTPCIFLQFTAICGPCTHLQPQLSAHWARRSIQRPCPPAYSTLPTSAAWSSRPSRGSFSSPLGPHGQTFNSCGSTNRPFARPDTSNPTTPIANELCPGLF
jgi:hypothetical protein